MTIGYVCHGHGAKRVLVMHDWSGDRTNYDPVLPYLDPDRFTYAFVDLRGYGLSRDLAGDYTVEEAASDCFAVADRLGWERFHILGHSMTGMVTQWMALSAQPRIASAIAVCPVSAAGFPMDEENWRFFCSSTEDGALYRELQRSLCSDSLSGKWLDAKLAWNRSTTAVECRRPYLEMFSRTNFADRITGLATPYLVVVGELDVPGLRAPDMKQSYLAMHPGAELVEIAGCGHYPMQECPPRFATVVEDFLTRQRD